MRKKLIINGYRWYVDLQTLKIYECEIGGESIAISQFNSEELNQIYNQLHYDKPMITY